MKKFIQMAVLQVVLGLVFVNGAKGAVECGHTFRSEQPDSSKCNCEGSPMDLYQDWHSGTWRCCGWVVGEGTEQVCRAYPAGEYSCGESIPEASSLEDVFCSCEGATWTRYKENMFEQRFCCGWVKSNTCNRAEPSTLKATCGETYAREEKDGCICGGSSSETTMANGQICCGWLIEGQCEATDMAIVGDSSVSAQTLSRLNPLIIGGGDTSLSTPGGIISKALGSYIFPIAGIILFIQLLLGGFQMMIGAGNAKSTADGKQKIISALIGFILIFAAYWITQLLELIFGINILS